MIGTQKRIDSKVFIEAVKKFPEIFDTGHPGFKQHDDKSGAWEKIAREFHSDVETCRKKFRTLRERYTRELRRSYLEPNTATKFEYFKQLSFLNPYIKFRSIMFETSTETGKTIVTKRDDDHKNISEIKMIDGDGYYEEEDEHEAEPSEVNIIYETTSADQIHHTEFQTSQIVSDQQHLEDLCTQPSSSKKRKIDSWEEFEDDENGDRSFSMSIACSLKRLSTINNLKAKVEIYQIIEKYASKEKM